MIYTLKIYDTELMAFELTQKLLEGFCCQIVSVKEENKHLLPLGQCNEFSVKLRMPEA